MRNRYILLILVLLWAFPPIVIKYLNAEISPTTQNFFRFFSAALFLVIFSFFYDRGKFLEGVRNIRFFILPALLVVFSQLFYVYGIMLGQANTSSFIAKIDALFSIIFAYFLLKEERIVLKHTSFIAGIILAFSGIALITFAKSSSIFNMSLLFILFTAVLIGLYSVTIKRALARTKVKENVAVAIVFSIVSLLYLPLSIRNLNEIFKVSALTNTLLFGSGILFMGVAGILFYYLLKNIGVVITMNALLLTPFLTLLFSYLLIKEQMTLTQFLAGILMIIGFWFIIKSEKRLK